MTIDNENSEVPEDDGTDSTEKATETTETATVTSTDANDSDLKSKITEPHDLGLSDAPSADDVSADEKE
ncbi:MAG: hypothetical protein JWQ43_733 [Glaciihabitans sp.]|nr:hypothetical protein [Glaciihabitans sp.]